MASDRERENFQFQELGKVLKGGNKVTEIMGGASPKLGRGLKWIDTRSACRIWVRRETLPKGLVGPGGGKMQAKNNGNFLDVFEKWLLNQRKIGN